MEDSPEPYSCFISLVPALIQTIPLQALFAVAGMLVLLFFSALISGSEVAFFSLEHHHIDALRKGRKASDRRIIQLLEKPDRLLATILIANNVINIAVIILSSFVFRSLIDFETWPLLGFLIQVILVTFLILLFAEVLPKLYATQHAQAFATMMAGPLSMLRKIFYPVSSLLVRSTRMIDRRMARKKPNISMHELSHALDITSDETTTQEDRNILKGIVGFGNIYAREIMKSRLEVVAVDISTEFPKLIEIILDAGYSRIPVYRNSFDNVVGILYIKDLLPFLEESQDFKWQSLLRSCFFVPESKKINDLLKEFQEKKIHMAIVVDEYGGTSGIITLEDILEEIVGEINDEFDTEEALYTRIDENSFVFEGRTLLKDFCRITGSDYQEFDDIKGEADTLAGLILEIKKELPPRGDKISFSGFDLVIEGVDTRRIKRIRYSKKKTGTE